jgi:hypothetical protein
MTDVLKSDVVGEPRRPKIDPELVEQLMAAAGDEVDLLDPDGLLSSLTKAVMERAMKAECLVSSATRRGIRLGVGRGTRATGLLPRR